MIHKIRQLTVEIRGSKFETDNVQETIEGDDVNDSIGFVQTTNAICECKTMHTKCLNEDPQPCVSKISIDIPNSYDQLQQLLAPAIPKHYGPAVIERKDGRQILPGSCTFLDGETIVFREIRPPSIQDCNIQNFHKTFNEPDMYSSLGALCASIR